MKYLVFKYIKPRINSNVSIHTNKLLHKIYIKYFFNNTRGKHASWIQKYIKTRTGKH